ncbi:MAG: prolyl oligopeptidase family serine peptidase [Jatrophihabitans sp.]
MRYPPTRTVEQVESIHGTAVRNPFQWLERHPDREVDRWVDQQDAFARSWIECNAPGHWFADRLAARLHVPWRGSPCWRGEREFQLRRGANDEHQSLWLTVARSEHCLVGPDDLAAVGATALAAAVPSPDGSLLAWLAMANGSDWLTLRVRDVESGRDLDDTVRWLKSRIVAWLPDSTGFFYLRFRAPLLGAELTAEVEETDIALHVLGSDPHSDLSVHRDRSSLWMMPHVAVDGGWLLVQQRTGTAFTGIVAHRLAAGGLDPADGWRTVADRSSVNLLLGATADTAYLVTFRDAPHGRLVAVCLPHGTLGDCRTVLAESDTVFDATRGVLGESYLLREHLVAITSVGARSRVRVISLDGAEPYDVHLPGLSTVRRLEARADGHELFLEVAQVAGPTVLLRHDVRDGSTTELFRAPAHQRSRAAYIQQHEVQAGDGELVPMLLVGQSMVTRDGDRPVLLCGYGGFGINYLLKAYEPWHDVWLDAGGMLAFAAVRGGGELGAVWHEQGRRQHKQNSFEDLFCCARWLIADGWTRPGRLAVAGSSNGGLLVAAAITQQPDMFAAAVCDVPLVDVLRFHRYTVGGPWVSEYGDPDDPDDFQTLLGYAPLERVRAGTGYPAVLVLTGDHDDRVPPGAHAYKLAAALQAAQAAEAPILLRVERNGGHGPGTGATTEIRQRADVLAFLARALNMAVAATAPERQKGRHAR